MIHEVHVRNFQSLHDVEVELGGLTVIVGPSSVGKSAFMRAMKTLTSNRRGAEFISHGERTAAISAKTDKGTVTLTRSRGTSDNAYIVTPADPGHPLAPQREFTKLGGETPPEVSDFLGIQARDPINYAGQFDKPYLLDDSASEVARTLGSLTNVNVIFEAARESNRRKLQAAATFRTRSEDLQAITNKIPGYRALKSQAEELTRAEEHIRAARTLELKADALERAIEQLAAAEVAIEQHRAAAERHIPSAEAILSAQERLSRLTTAIKASQAASEAHRSAQSTLLRAEEALAEQEEAYTELIGTLSDDLAGWIAATARSGTIDTTTFDEHMIELPEAIRVFTLYLETRATS